MKSKNWDSDSCGCRKNLLHNLNRYLYDAEVKACHLFDYMKKWKQQGKIRHAHPNPSPKGKVFFIQNLPKTLDAVFRL